MDSSRIQVRRLHPSRVRVRVGVRVSVRVRRSVPSKGRVRV